MQKFPGFDRIYSLHDPLSNRPQRGRFEATIDSLALSRGETALPKEIQISWAMGGAIPCDFIWTTSACPVIAHHRVINLLRKHRFTGWSTYPVKVTNKAGHAHPDYEGLVITGRCGSVDLARSVVVLSEYPASWAPHFLGYYFAEDSWDGSDFFMQRADSKGQVTGCRFITEKVQQVFKQAKIKNIRLDRLIDQSEMASIYEIGKPYLLPSDYAQRVAAAYTRAGIPIPSKYQG